METDLASFIINFKSLSAYYAAYLWPIQNLFSVNDPF